MTPASRGGPVRAVGSASIWVLGQVAGPAQSAPVLHVGRDAVYLDLEGVCLAVLGARAVQLPCGVRTTLAELPPMPADATATIADGTIHLPGLEVLVTTIVDTTVPVLSAEQTEWGSLTLDELVGDRLKAVHEQLPQDALDALAEGDPAAAKALLGLGSGLTPLGDDVLAGWLAAAVASRHPMLAPLRSGVALQARQRTSTLSATLLNCAARGEGVPEFHSLLTGMATANRDVVAQALDLMLAIGDTSGAGLVLGALIALDAPVENDALSAGAA